MGKLYDDNPNSSHGPFGEKQNAPGPWGGKNNTKNVSANFPDEKPVKPVPKS